ncbi:MAG: hypothetical protein C0476_03455 [Sphingomonas sp.]|nr:hypothetical protein [Sphingomonas sp.]
MTDDERFGPPQTRRGWRTTLLLLLIAFGGGIGATALFVAQYRPWLMAGGPALQPVAAPQAAVPAPGPFTPPPEIGAAPQSPDERVLTMRIGGLAAQLAALEARTMAVDREARGAAGYAGRAESMFVVFAARRAIDRGLALGAVEPVLRARFVNTRPREVAAILAASRTPVTVADLRLGLDAIAPDLATGTRRDGWLAGLQRELSGLIVLHRDTTPSPHPNDRLKRARALLDAAHVEPALAEVSRLPGAPSATSWISAARRYVEAHRALDVLESAALTGAVPPAPTPMEGADRPAAR